MFFRLCHIWMNLSYECNIFYSFIYFIGYNFVYETACKSNFTDKATGL